jgi:hypothetical protein
LIRLILPESGEFRRCARKEDKHHDGRSDVQGQTQDFHVSHAPFRS